MKLCRLPPWPWLTCKRDVNLNPIPLIERRINKTASHGVCLHFGPQHLVSDKHRRFLQETSNYSVLDQLVASLLPGFDPDPPQHTDPSLDR